MVVWGNCQAAPIAALLRAPLAAHGLDVADVPPVYLASAADVRRTHELVARCGVLVTQAIRDEYRIPGCGSDQLAALTPPDARVVRVPTVYDVGAFPFQARGYDGSGERVDAPITDYHDLRILQASARGAGVDETVQAVLTPIDASADAPADLTSAARDSLERLRQREAGLDVTATDLVTAPDALWTMTHPTNTLLAALTARILDALDIADRPSVPEREFLGQRRAPVQTFVADQLGWPTSAVRPEWIVDGQVRPWDEVVATQLAFYAGRPDVVRASLQRNAARFVPLAPPG